jgi:hypothetical protein
MGQEREASPGCRGMGKRVKSWGRAWPDKTIPRGGSPKSKKIKMVALMTFVEDMGVS